MKFFGNLIWFLLGGLLCGTLWVIYGILWCCTIIGIPYGRQCFKFAKLAFAPFGKEVESGGGIGSFLLNIIWFFSTGLEMAAVYAALGCIFCITIVGIPFGMQFFKFARLSLVPFGTRVK